MTVLDTGAPLNLIRADLLPDETILDLEKSRETINLASASNHRLDVIGIAALSISIASHKTRQQFSVVKRLGADVILGCTIMAVRIKNIRPRKKIIEIRDETMVPIRRHPHQVPLDCGRRKTKQITTVKKPDGHIRVSKRTVLASELETNM